MYEGTLIAGIAHERWEGGTCPDPSGVASTASERKHVRIPKPKTISLHGSHHRLEKARWSFRNDVKVERGLFSCPGNLEGTGSKQKSGKASTQRKV